MTMLMVIMIGIKKKEIRKKTMTFHQIIMKRKEKITNMIQIRITEESKKMRFQIKFSVQREIKVMPRTILKDM